MTDTTAASLTGSGVRARPGELRNAVAAHLIAHAGQSLTVTEVANALKRSGGAVGNALASLEAGGLARLTGTSPRRYAACEAAASPPRRPALPASSPPSTPHTAPPAVQPPVSGPVSRPNGQLYHPRDLAGLPDVTVLRRLRSAGVPVLLSGPPGTGKTSLIEAAFPDLITVAGDGDTSVADLIGEYTQAPDGSYTWINGPLVRAMTEGRVLLIDDATLISPKVLAAMYPAMDGRRQIIVKAHLGESVTAADGFYVVAGHNPGVAGAVLTEALASRFCLHIQVESDYDLAKSLGIPAIALKIARQCARRRDKGEIGWAPQLRELLGYQKIAAELGSAAALANLVGIAPAEDREIVAQIARLAYGAPIRPLRLGAQI